MTDTRCYNRATANGIVVSFEQCNPAADDWIGIYPALSDVDSLGLNYRAWSMACGDKDCRGETPSNSITLESTIETGWYQVYFVRDGDSEGPFTSAVSSEVFRVTDLDCADVVLP